MWGKGPLDNVDYEKNLFARDDKTDLNPDKNGTITCLFFYYSH